MVHFVSIYCTGAFWMRDISDLVTLDAFLCSSAHTASRLVSAASAFARFNWFLLLLSALSLFCRVSIPSVCSSFFLFPLCGFPPSRLHRCTVSLEKAEEEKEEAGHIERQLG